MVTLLFRDMGLYSVECVGRHGSVWGDMGVCGEIWGL